jgi:NAD-dependent dihydropyrimidine dehydrogenase PreA subunit
MRPRINLEFCKACGICARICPAEAISGERGVPYEIDLEKCSDCLRCLEECPFDAITRGGERLAEAEAMDR